MTQQPNALTNRLQSLIEQTSELREGLSKIAYVDKNDKNFRWAGVINKFTSSEQFVQEATKVNTSELIKSRINSSIIIAAGTAFAVFGFATGVIPASIGIMAAVGAQAIFQANKESRYKQFQKDLEHQFEKLKSKTDSIITQASKLLDTSFDKTQPELVPLLEQLSTNIKQIDELASKESSQTKDPGFINRLVTSATQRTLSKTQVEGSKDNVEIQPIRNTQKPRSLGD